MHLAARLGMDGPKYDATLKLKEREGLLNLLAHYNTATEAYQADLHVDALQVHHFLPKDSIYTLSAKVAAKGKDSIPPTTVPWLLYKLLSANYNTDTGIFPVLT